MLIRILLLSKNRSFSTLLIYYYNKLIKSNSTYYEEKITYISFIIIIYLCFYQMSNQIQQQTRQKNKKKLIQQNIRLHTQLFKLQKEIQLLEDYHQDKLQQQPIFSQLKSQIELQQKQIRQLKQAVDVGRQSNAKENVYYIKKQEDELLFVKQQLQTLLKQKELVARAHQDKLAKLAANQPLLKHKEELQKSWNQTKKQNRQMSLKLVELQRQIRKYHNLKEMSKNNNGSSSTEQIELLTFQTQIARMNSQMKMKQLKWKPNGQVLDNQFFSNKNILQTINKKIQELDKQEGVWRLRAAALRDQSQIKTDRKRLSKIVSMTKPQPIIKIPSTPKQEVKKPTMQMILQKQIRNNIKNDKFVDLVRVSSTPSAASSLKKSIQLQPIQVQTPTKKKNHQIALFSSKDKKQIVSPLPNSSNIKKSESIKLPLKKQKSQKEEIVKQSSKQSLKILKNQQIVGQNKNGSNWLGRRGKIKSKQANATALAQIIQKKAEQVKKINKKLQKQQKERSVSSPKKKREKNNSSQRVETQLNEKRSKEKVQPKQNKISNPNRIMLKQNVSKASLQIQQEQNKSSDKKKPSQGKNIPKMQKQKQLVQRIDLSAKLNNFPNQKKSNSQKPVVNKPIENKKTPRQSSPQEQKRKDKIQQRKPQSPINQQRPVFQIFMSDANSKIRLASNNQTKNPDIDDQNDGIPKIIKRKRKVQGQLVTIGTST